MKIVYFANASVPSRTANSVHIMKMCEALGSLGHDVRLIVPNQGLPELDGTDPFAYYGAAPTFRLTKTPWMRRHPQGLRDIAYVTLWGLWMRLTGRPDLCVTRNVWAGLIFPILGIRTLLELHMPVPERSRMAGLLRRTGAFRRRGFAGLVVISESLRNYFIGFGVAPGRIRVLHDAVNPAPFLSAAASAPARPPVSGSGLAVGYIGSLNRGKGMEIITELARLDAGNTYHVFGGAPADIARWRGTAGSPDNVKFHGHIPNSLVPEKIAAMDVVLMPYQRQVSVSGNYGDVAQWMSPLKMFEYMAAGKAIVSSDLPVLREILEDGRNALLADPDAIDPWLAAIRRLAEDPGLRARLGENARRDALQNHTWERRAAAILA